MTGNNNNAEGARKMLSFTLRIEKSLLDQSRLRADNEIRSLSAVIRRFLELWIAGKINLDDYKDELEEIG